jgi:hypothetical protein
MPSALRTDDYLVEICGITLKRAEPYDFSKAQQLPNYRYFLERYCTLLTDLEAKHSKNQGSRVLAQKEVLKELRAIWCTLNVYPLKLKHLLRQFNIFFTKFHNRTCTKPEKRTPAWQEITIDKLYLNKLDCGLDILCKREEGRVEMENEWGVKMEKNDFEFYEDNCILKDGKCQRKMFSTAVDKAWLVHAKNRFQRWQEQERREAKEKEDAFNRRSLVGAELEKCFASIEGHASTESIPDKDDDFIPSFASPSQTPISPKPMLTRQTHSSETETKSENFPQIQIRSGTQRGLNKDIVEVLVTMESKFAVPTKSRELLCFIGNKLFQQDWKTAEEIEERPSENPSKKIKQDLSFTMPVRSTVMDYVKDAALLNFQYAAGGFQD